MFGLCVGCARTKISFLLLSLLFLKGVRLTENLIEYRNFSLLKS